MIKKTAFKITRVGQLVAGEASKHAGYSVLELSICLLHRLRQWVTVSAGDPEEIGLERVVHRVLQQHLLC